MVFVMIKTNKRLLLKKRVDLVGFGCYVMGFDDGRGNQALQKTIKGVPYFTTKCGKVPVLMEFPTLCSDKNRCPVEVSAVRITSTTST